MKHFLLIRHGLPHEGHPTRADDPPLLPEGHEHARRLARNLAREGIDRIVCSPQQRAIDTATPLATQLDLPIEIIAGFAEVDRFAGRYRSGETLFAEGRWAEFVASPARYMGRDPSEYHDTVMTALEQVANDDRGTRIAIFSHGMTIKVMLFGILGLYEEALGRMTTAHCSVSRLSGEGFTRPGPAGPRTARSLRQLKIDSVNEDLVRER